MKKILTISMLMVVLVSCNQNNSSSLPDDKAAKEMLQGAGGQGSSLGTGGMATKLSAAKIAMDAGVDMIIVNGASPEIIYDAVNGRSVGTRFIAKK